MSFLPSTPTGWVAVGILVGAIVLIGVLELRLRRRVARHRREHAAARRLLGAAYRQRNGQALVELAVALPVLMLVALGFLEAGRLMVTKAAQDRDTATVAAWVAVHPSEAPGPVVGRLDSLRGCDLEVSLDDDLGIVTATASCRYEPLVTKGLRVFDNTVITSTEVFALTAPEPSASSPSSPSPEPSVLEAVGP